MSESLPIVYQDEHLVAVNKPSGLLVHRSAIDRHETRFALQILRDQLEQHVFPIHRLDKPTSGVLLFALSSVAAQKTAEIFSQHQVQKTYVAIVRGHIPEQGIIDHPLREERDGCADKKMRQDKPPQPALTEYKRLGIAEIPVSVDKYPTTRYSLVRCCPRTGRKHQLRRHLKYISHPIIGDAKHGKGHHNRFFHQQFFAQRLLLAATELTLPHPYSGEHVKICAPLDATFCRVLHLLNWSTAVPADWLGKDQHAPG
jgi:tRNA pseudouridine65 synthase